MVTEQHFLHYEKITNFPIIETLLDASVFFNDIYPNIIAFYSGEAKRIGKEDFKILDKLISDFEDCTRKFDESKKIFQMSYFWEILDLIEDIKFKLYSAKNTSKFVRSSILNGSHQSGILTTVTLDSGQTLEDVSETILGDSNRDDDWISVAIENDLKEHDWDIDGGRTIQVRKRQSQSDLVTSFIDNTVEKKIYGRDIKNKITFLDDDLEVLDENSTLSQSIETLAGLCKDDIPEFNTIGITSDLFKGINYSEMNMPAIIRELTRSFRTDDLFEEINVLEFKHEEGDIFITFEVKTKLGEVIIQNTTI